MFSGDRMKNREMRRKEKNYSSGVTYSDDNEMRNLIFIIVVVAVLFAGIYLVSTLVFDKQNSTTKVPTSEIQYTNILYTNVFNRSEKEYYVMLYDFDKPTANTMNYISSNYQREEKALPVYVVNLKDSFNKSIYTTGKSNPKATKATELKVTDPTLIHIKNKKVVKYVEGMEAIAKYLK